MLFFLKKLISRMLFPLPLSLILLAVALFFAFRRKISWAVRLPLLLALLILFFGSFNGTALLLMRPLETTYTPLAVGGVPFPNDALKSRYVVVLGGGATFIPDVPPASRLSDASLSRLVEGVRLVNLLPKTQLVFTGGEVDSPIPIADAMTMGAISMGVSPQRIHPIPSARDTAEEIESISKVVGKQPFILVTSAAHMPRAMKLCQARGLNPIAAPAQFIADRHDLFSWNTFNWSIQSLERTTNAVYEYMGTAWAWLNGWFAPDKEEVKQPASTPQKKSETPAQKDAQQPAQ